MYHRVDRALRLPHLRITVAAGKAAQLPELSQLHLCSRELLVRRERRPYIDELLNLLQSSSKCGLIIALATEDKRGHCGF